jgi:glutathione reductase (NADPH)
VTLPFDYDLFVIGGGSGGVRAARIAAAEGGARVGLAEESRMGGTCVIRGCVPKKLMVNASAYPKAMQDAAAYGWDVQAGAFDWPKFRKLLGAELTRLENAYRGTLKNAGVVVHDARASVADAHTVRPPSRLPLSVSLDQRHGRLRPCALHRASRLHTGDP